VDRSRRLPVDNDDGKGARMSALAEALVLRTAWLLAATSVVLGLFAR